MTDKELKAKILAEIEKKIKVLSPFIHQGSDTCGKVVRQLESLVSFINSLSEEPVSKDLEEEYHEFLKREWFGKPGKTISEQMFFTAQYFAQWQKEKSIDKAIKWLKENARLYLITHSRCIDDYDDKTLIEDFRKVLEEE